DTDDDNYDSENLTQLTVEDLNAHIYHPEVPPGDMIIRTSGEERISGFMLWRAAYSEFMFINKTFPDVDESVVDDILAEYGHRHRRFGK
ncbi:undecaprenyl diphosphate synthase family protein, partial [Candidatus Saccharibacteria bacterium]|nr:undecaprenyl diphosphate synthase family protein [Candidatus Saccharibacteria bacterium]